MAAFHCPNCDKWFKTSSGFAWHREHVHATEVTTVSASASNHAHIDSFWDGECPLLDCDEEASFYAVWEPSIVFVGSISHHLGTIPLKVAPEYLRREALRRQPAVASAVN